MVTFVFFLVLLITIQITNKKNDAKASNDVLEFERSDSFIIFLCFISSLIGNIILKNLKLKVTNYLVILFIFGFIYAMILIIVNNNREKIIKEKHDRILNVYQALTDILGKFDPSEINFEETPFSIEEDPKTHLLNKITIDTSILPSNKFNDNTVILSQYSINKFFQTISVIKIISII